MNLSDLRSSRHRVPGTGQNVSIGEVRRLWPRSETFIDARELIGNYNSLIGNAIAPEFGEDL
jgi:hypothetical protein